MHDLPARLEHPTIGLHLGLMLGVVGGSGGPPVPMFQRTTFFITPFFGA